MTSRTVRLGDQQVTRIGLGTNRLRNTDDHVAFIREAVDAGVQLIDTARLYTAGESEQSIGRAVGGATPRAIVATKGGYGDSGRGKPEVLRQEIAQSLAEKASHYGVKNCSTLDALVYVDLSGRHLWPLEAALEPKTADELTRQGWRSVSMVFLPYGAVLAAKPDAPPWLKDKVKRILHEWPHPDGWFDA